MATKQTAPIPRQDSTASRIRARILAEGERFWTYQDFDAYPLGTAAQALSRLTKEGILERTGKGLYYRPRQTSLGKSRPSQARNAELSAKHKLYPSGIAAANILGFTTQNAARPQYATSGTNTPTKLHGSKVYTRRPVERDNLSTEDGALLEFLRARGNTSELSAEQTAAGSSSRNFKTANASSESRRQHNPNRQEFGRCLALSQKRPSNRRP
jgi:hypothetical protein